MMIKMKEPISSATSLVLEMIKRSSNDDDELIDNNNNNNNNNNNIIVSELFLPRCSPTKRRQEPIYFDTNDDSMIYDVKLDEKEIMIIVNEDIVVESKFSESKVKSDDTKQTEIESFLNLHAINNNDNNNNNIIKPTQIIVPETLEFIITEEIKIPSAQQQQQQQQQQLSGQQQQPRVGDQVKDRIANLLPRIHPRLQIQVSDKINKKKLDRQFKLELSPIVPSHNKSKNSSSYNANDNDYIDNSNNNNNNIDDKITGSNNKSTLFIHPRLLRK